MKRWLVSVFLFLLVGGMIAQTKTTDAEVRLATEELTDLYGLDEAQQLNMIKIQERRFRNLKEIESLKTHNYSLYLHKRQSIREGTEGSIRRLLHPEQLPIFEARLLERRKQTAALIKEMKTRGATKEEIQQAILEM